MQKILRIFTPNLFYKEPIPKITNKSLLNSIDKVRKTSSTKKAMQTALDILSQKYSSQRFATYYLFPKIFEVDPNKLWTRSGFMHCNQQNYLFRILIVESGKIKDNQIYLAFSLVWYISLHQYLVIKLKNELIAADPWNYGRGAALGKYASGFSMNEI